MNGDQCKISGHVFFETNVRRLASCLDGRSKTNTATWENFVARIQAYYKPTENLTLKNHQFRTLTQATHESFPAFFNRVYKEAQHCNFKCQNDDCTIEGTAIRDQIIIGKIQDKIRKEALKNSWDLQKLRKEGMQIERLVQLKVSMS